MEIYATNILHESLYYISVSILARYCDIIHWYFYYSDLTGKGQRMPTELRGRMRDDDEVDSGER